MSKIKITEAQAKMLQKLDNSKKVMKITEAQFKLIESELNTIPKSQRPSLKVAKAFKKAGVTEDDDLLGHPVAGKGGDEYNPQTVDQNKKTTKSFNEGEVNESLDMLPTDSEFIANTLEFIKGIYNNDSQAGLSTFWVKNGFTHGELNKILTAAGILVGGIYAGDKTVRLAKKLSPAKMIKKGAAILKGKTKEKVKNTMKKRVPTVSGPNKPKDPNDLRYSKVAEAGKSPKPYPEANPKLGKPVKRKSPKPYPEANPELGEPKSRKAMQPRPKQLANPEVSEDDGYPMGAANDPRAPYNQTDASRMVPTTPNTSILQELYTNSEMSILVGKDGKKFLFTFDHIPKEEFVEYSDVEYSTSKGEDGDVDYEIDYDTLDIDGEVIERYVNDNFKEIQKGSGIEGLDDGMDLNLIDDTLANKILSIWNTDDNLRKVLGIQETTTAGGSSGAFVAPLGTDVIKGKIKETTAPKISMFSDEEGVEMKTMDDVTEEVVDEEVEEIEEVTTTASVGGSYVTPMMWAKDKDSHKPSKKTQYPKGKFVQEGVKLDKVKQPFIELAKRIEAAKVNGTNVIPVKLSDKSLDYFHIQGLDIHDELMKFHLYVSPKKDEILNKFNRGHEITDSNINISKWLLKLYNTMLDAGEMGKVVNLKDINNPKINESNQSDTAYPEGKFVEFDDCTKLNNNKEAQNGGCSTGAVDGVTKEKGSKNSVISKEALYYEIAKKTGKSEKEVESIIEGYLLNKAK